MTFTRKLHRRRDRWYMEASALLDAADPALSPSEAKRFDLLMDRINACNVLIEAEEAE